MPEPLLRCIDAVTVPVPDLDEGLRFYGEQLGHQVRWRNESVGQVGLAVGGSELVLTTRQQYEPNWLVDSVEGAVERWVGSGGTVRVEPFDIPVGRLVVVGDPFGNELVLLDLSKGRYGEPGV